MRGSPNEGAGSANGDSGNDPCVLIDNLLGSPTGKVAGLGLRTRPIGVKVSGGYGRFRDVGSVPGRAKAGEAAGAGCELLCAYCWNAATQEFNDRPTETDVSHDRRLIRSQLEMGITDSLGCEGLKTGRTIRKYQIGPVWLNIGVSDAFGEDL